MRLLNHKIVCAIVLNVLYSSSSLAQQRLNARFLPYSTISFGAGTSTYVGQLAPYGNGIKSLLTLPRPNIAFGYMRQFTPNVAVRATFTWARILGDDYTYSRSNPTRYAFQYARNLHFRNDLKEFALTGVYNFEPDGRKSIARAKFTPYIFGGIALLVHNPKALTPLDPFDVVTTPQQWLSLQLLHTAGQGQPGHDRPYSLVTASMPIGAGFRYKLNENITIGCEIGFRYTWTDYLDDVGRNDEYADPSTLSDLGVLLSNRQNESTPARYGNAPDRITTLFELLDNDPTLLTNDQRTSPQSSWLNDGYLLTNFSIQFILPNRIRCPVPKKR